MKVAYRRVSSLDQSLERQLVDHDDIEKVFEEKVSGASRDRPALEEMIAFVRDGDTVVVHSLDRLGRDIRDLLNIVSDLNTKGVTVEFASERLRFSDNIDDDPLARLQLHMLSAFAQWERSTAKRRQAEGIARTKQLHPERYRGRPAKIDPAAVQELIDQGLGATTVAAKLGIGRATVYRLIRSKSAGAD